MLLNDRVTAFCELGKFLTQFKSSGNKKVNNIIGNDVFFEEMSNKITSAVHYNGWFTEDNVIFAIEQWANALTEKNLTNWLSRYNIGTVQPKTIGIIMAGNIPLVGFHDFLSTLITGHKVVIKQSSSDNKLLPFLASYLISIEPRFKERITFTEDRLQNFDGIIATGSNNTARYFEYYFGKVPNIIRKNRNSIAILTGQETASQLKLLGEDIFRYFGLGCRSVSKIMVPKDYNFNFFFESIYPYHSIINNAKYANNYDYNKAVYLMSNFKLFENGFLILKEDVSYSSPIGSLFYETYETLDEVYKKLETDTEKIQCIVGHNIPTKSIEFGQSQEPQLWDYADGIDTINFLTKII
ncbi:acyl-CoA reductase [Aquimarina pacifica]|uniref:acyl-CoA reductase n=1 Tax=Aquimarina pacifica TaxID=1296415 RepID=UPI0004705D73|nr:acyl-CoA reductase [Aquimarina pacifica]